MIYSCCLVSGPLFIKLEKLLATLKLMLIKDDGTWTNDKIVAAAVFLMNPFLI